MADFYTDDATYGWNIGPKEDVMCVGIDEIRDIALGLEMEGLEGWNYQYQRVLIDDKIGEIVGFWKQVVTDADGTEAEIYGIGGSWFRYAGTEDRVAARLLRLRPRLGAVHGPDQGRQAVATACRSASSAAWPARRCPATTRWARVRFRSGRRGPAV